MEARKSTERGLLPPSPAAATSPFVPRHVTHRCPALLVSASQSFAFSRRCDLKDRLIPKTIVACQIDNPARPAADRAQAAAYPADRQDQADHRRDSVPGAPDR